MRRLLLVLVLLLCFVPTLLACAQARCAWQNTRNSVGGAFDRPCTLERCDGPMVVTDPVYDPVCASPQTGP